MSKFFINHPVFTTVITLVISIVGILCIMLLPVDRYPQITPPQVRVNATYPGADAEVMGTTVAQVIEKQVIGVNNFDNMVSTSNSNGSYTLTAQFLNGSDPDMDAVQIQNSVSQASAGLPSVVESLGVTTKKSTGDMVLVFTLTSPNGTYDSTFLKNYFSMNYLDELKNIKGVGNVMEFGSDYAMRVWLDPTKMAKNNVTAAAVVSAINDQNQQVVAGSLGAPPDKDTQSFTYTISSQGRLVTADEFGNVVIRTNSDGTMLRLKDVARVELDANNYNFIARGDGDIGAGYAFSLTNDANALETVGAIKAKLAEDAKTFPADMKYTVSVDNTDFIKASITEVLHTFVEALILVALIVYLFLQNWRATFIPMIAVPVSLLGTFAAFKVLGFTINTLTLFAMVLAIGLLVDDAIVVIEAVEYEMRYNGKSPKEASFLAMQKVQSPVIGVAAVLSAVFVPVAFLGGVMGVLYRQFALTIAVSVLISAFIALSLTPMLCATMLKKTEHKENENILRRFFNAFNDGFDHMTEKYGMILEKMGHRLAVPIGFLVILTGVSVFMFTKLPTGFIPNEDNGFYLNAIQLPEGATTERTDAEILKYMNYLKTQPGVDHTQGVTGFDILSYGQKPNAGIVFVKLKPWDERKTPDLGVDNFVKKAFVYSAMNPGVTIMGMNPSPIPGLGASGGFTMYIENKSGDTNENMNAVVQKFLVAANKRPEIQTAYTTFRMDTPAYNFDVDRDKAMRSGVNLSNLFTTLQVYYGSVQINDFTIFGHNFKVIAQADKDYRMTAQGNKFLTVNDSKGNMIPISNFITPKQTGSIAVLTRFNNFPAVKIGGNQASGYSSGQALAALQEVAKETLPEGYSYEFAESSAQEIKAGNQTIYALVLGMLFVFLSLAALYESWKVPFSVLLGVPTGFFGACLAAFLLKVTNDIYFQIGLLTIIGLAAKNAILIIEYAKVRADKGMNPLKAAIEASKIRLRPILMTSLAFILGCVPLALSTGAGAVSRSEMGITVVFGVLSATALGIFLTPMLFTIIEEKLPGHNKHKTGTEEVPETKA